MSSAETTEHAQSSGNVPATVILSATLGKFVETIGKWGALFMLPLVFITVWDVLQRKTMTFIGNWMLANDYLAARDWMYGTLLELLPFRSTLLQELEWHFHVCLYTLVLGYGYIYNRHVRVDLVRAGAVDGEEPKPLLVDVGVGLRLRRVAARRVRELRDVRPRRSHRVGT